jgi:signal transduction histidine kinase
MLLGAVHRIRQTLDEWRYECAIFLLIAALMASGLFAGAQYALNDAAFRVVTRPPSGDIVIVQIDPKSLSAFSTWPWPRSRHGEVVKQLRAAGATVVGLDIDFSSPSTPQEDAAFAEALATADGQVVLPSFIQHESRGSSNTLTETNPLPSLREHALVGNANIFAPMGKARRASFGLYLEGGRYRPAFAALIGQHGHARISSFDIDFGIDITKIQYLSITDVLNGNFDPATVKGKRVLVGATAIELGDYMPVPIHGVLPGVVLQALIAETILQERTLTSTGGYGSLLLVFLVLLALRPTRSSWSFGGVGLRLALTVATVVALPLIVLAALPIIVETAPALATALTCFACGGLKELSTRARTVMRERVTGNQRRMLVDLIVDESSDGVVVADKNGRIGLCNERAAALLSATRSTLLTRQVGRYLPRYEDMATVAEAETNQRQTELTVDCDGGSAMLEIVARRMTLPQVHDGDPAGHVDVYTLRNVTARRRAEEAEKRAQEQRLMAERAKANFISNMSHELRTPLNAIIGFSEMIANQVVGPAGQPQYVEFADAVAKSGHHLLALVNNILEISRIDNDSDTLFEEEIDFDECAEASAAFARISRDRKSQTISVQVADGAKRLRADRRVIKQILANLLSNAVKFTKPQGRIDVRAWTEGDAFCFEVADDGTGIDPALMPHLTDLFRHADQGFTRKHEGMGAGLYLVKRFVSVMKGSLSFDSEVGKGTRVRVSLPGAAVAERPAANEAA